MGADSGHRGLNAATNTLLEWSEQAQIEGKIPLDKMGLSARRTHKKPQRTGRFSGAFS